MRIIAIGDHSQFFLPNTPEHAQRESPGLSFFYKKYLSIIY